MIYLLILRIASIKGCLKNSFRGFTRMRLADLYMKDRQENGCNLLYVGFRSVSLRFGLAQVLESFLIGRRRNWVFATNSNFLIPISLQTDDVNL